MSATRLLPVDIQYYYSDPYNEFNILYQEKFWHGQGFQRPLTLRNTTGYVEVAFAGLSVIEKITVITNDTQTDLSTFYLRITVDYGSGLPYEMTIPFIKFFDWNVPSTFVGYITKVEVATDSIIDQYPVCYFITVGTAPTVQ